MFHAIPVQKPPWLKIRPPTTEQYNRIREMIGKQGLHTVCREAHCPNMSECWSQGTASFLILGDVCTRHCRFCATKTAATGKTVDEKEPKRLAETVREMKLNYVVITSVDRDDLPDSGAGHFAACVAEVKKRNPGTRVELLVPDFGGKQKCVETVLEAEPDVFGHNLETVKRLQGKARDRKANYAQSLAVLRLASEWNEKNNRLDSGSRAFTKSALMLGMGETREEILETMDDLREAGTELLSIGQYLQPSPDHYSLQRFVSPNEFEELKKIAVGKGFLFCQSGPFVRSSYKAGEFFFLNPGQKNGLSTKKSHKS